MSDQRDQLITELSEKLSQNILKEEDNLVSRARFIDGDVADILQEVGRQTSQKILEETCQNLIDKKKRN